MHESVTESSFVENEKKILQFWEDNDIAKKSLKQNAKCFNFYEGPPTANGMPHIGHVLTRVFKDCITRYKTAKGYKVYKKAGWDTHGLPVELEVEKKLKISGKQQIERYGVRQFIEQCKESVFLSLKEWEIMSRRIGYWVDMKDAYITYSDDYIESVWWAIKKIWDMNLLYKDYKVVPYCPRCETSLSSHELAQGYKTVKEPSVVVKFKLIDDDTFFLVWTTTPWTLPSNVGLVVHPDFIYSKIKVNNENYILAKELISSVIEDEYEVLEEFEGRKLFGLKYEPLFNYEVLENAHFVVFDPYVSLSSGTGIVHLAPAFGEEDFKVAKLNNLPFLNLVDFQGKFVSKVTDYQGMFVKEADKKILADLKSRNLVFKIINYEHEYPFCWRCDTPLLYYAMSTWFIAMSKVKDKLIDNNNTVNWYPSNIKEGRFGNFLRNVVDWSLSRSRYWGTPLPIWECELKHRVCIGSKEELFLLSGIKDFDLHKPGIDEITWSCKECGSSMKRVPEVIDCWFDSGSMPFAEHHYPFENKELFEENFPADFISEAIDQTRGWFYTLLAISTLLFDRNSYKNVVVLGHVLDEKGIKMSKHKGNCVEPTEILNKYGADAVRWYFYSNNSPWIANKFTTKSLEEKQAKFIDTIWNVYNFYILYAKIDNFNANEYVLTIDELSVFDKWILSKLNKLIFNVTKNMDDYSVFESTKYMEGFVDDLSNWYLRLNRGRFWANQQTSDKISAYLVLYKVLTEFLKISAPFIPFVTEVMYKNLVVNINPNAKESIHLCDYPIFDDKFDFKEIETEMDATKRIVYLGRACRNTANIKSRQVLSLLYVKCPIKLSLEYSSIILSELNIKEIKFLDNIDGFVEYKLKPQLRTLGPKYGKRLSAIFEKLNSMDVGEIVRVVEEGGEFSFNFEGDDLNFLKSDFLIEIVKRQDLVSEVSDDYGVVLDTKLTDELISEGYVREIINKIQNLRKRSKFKVENYIIIEYSSNIRLNEILNDYYSKISEEVLAESMKLVSNIDETFDEIIVNDEKIMIKLTEIKVDGRNN